MATFFRLDQTELEADYKRELKKHFDIDFHGLYTLTNMPIGRFASWLKHSGKFDAYMQLTDRSVQPRLGRRPNVPEYAECRLARRSL